MLAGTPVHLPANPCRQTHAFAHAAYATYAFLLEPIGELELLFSVVPLAEMWKKGGVGAARAQTEVCMEFEEERIESDEPRSVGRGQDDG